MNATYSPPPKISLAPNYPPAPPPGVTSGYAATEHRVNVMSGDNEIAGATVMLCDSELIVDGAHAESMDALRHLFIAIIKYWEAEG